MFSWTLLRWVPALVWMGLIFALSAVPAADFPPAVSRKVGGIPVTDLAHLVEYGALVLLLLLALGRVTAGAAVLAALLASAYGVTDEIHQLVVPGRAAAFQDLGLDALGALTTAASTLAVRGGLGRLARSARGRA